MRHYEKEESWIQTTLPHLVEVGPIGADGQLYLSPGTSGWTGHVPNRHSHGTVVFFDIDI